MILKWIWKKDQKVVIIQGDRERFHRWDLVNTWSFGFHGAENSLSSWVTVRFLRNALHSHLVSQLLKWKEILKHKDSLWPDSGPFFVNRKPRLRCDSVSYIRCKKPHRNKSVIFCRHVLSLKWLKRFCRKLVLNVCTKLSLINYNFEGTFYLNLIFHGKISLNYISFLKIWPEHSKWGFWSNAKLWGRTDLYGDTRESMKWKDL